MSLIAKLAGSVGAPEPAIRLLLTIIAGYPIAAIYRLVIMHQASKPIHHLFFALCGSFLCVFNYGFNTYHSLIAIWVTYLLMRLLQKSPKHLVAVNFVFHMSYLLIGYFFTESNDYDILWTMPHCVLVLRMIGFGFDVADGQKGKESLSKDQQETALVDLPSLLELTAFAYFPCAFLVGPQFPYSRYRRFVDGEFRQCKGFVQTGVKRMLVGVLYLAIRQAGSMVMPESYFLTDDYRNQSFIVRLIYLGIMGKLTLYKYISCWLLTEGALMCLGFTYAGMNDKGEADWFGCSNVKLILLETGNTMGHYVQSFNVNTNHWVAQYIYKRLKFLNNRTISYAAALGFLAVWHGFHSGYYMSFLIEYMIVSTEKQIETVYEKDVLPQYGHILNASVPFKCLKFAALKSYNIIYMGWCLTPFVFLSYSRWISVMSAVNYFGFVYMAIWFLIYKIYQFQKRSAMKSNNVLQVQDSKNSENEKKDS
ncbi:lysophospholipid acyltransferase 5 [Teleopsis dalmanni]|uniref:lysophospholipid acyltransferase 5 n=1 Tax=Teleopsis dalmanni TaxID=139649 RepID=UPI0018CFE0E2|nr:lysophospholipid acyltransferase 5 [Teleopsis dalmanni]